MVIGVVGCGIHIFAVRKKSSPNSGRSEKSISSSFSARNRRLTASREGIAVRLVCFALIPARLSRRDYPNPAAALRIGDGDDATQKFADRLPSRFAICLAGILRNPYRSLEHVAGIFERNAVLPDVRQILRFIPFEHGILALIRTNINTFTIETGRAHV